MTKKEIEAATNAISAEDQATYIRLMNLYELQDAADRVEAYCDLMGYAYSEIGDDFDFQNLVDQFDRNVTSDETEDDVWDSIISKTVAEYMQTRPQDGEYTFRKGRWATVGMSYQMYGYVDVPLPDQLPDDPDNDGGAIEAYINDQFDQIKLPERASYVDESAELDFEMLEIHNPEKH